MSRSLDMVWQCSETQSTKTRFETLNTKIPTKVETLQGRRVFVYRQKFATQNTPRSLRNIPIDTQLPALEGFAALLTLPHNPFSALVLTLRSVVLVRVCTRSGQDAFSAPRYLRAKEKFMQKLFRYEFRESFESVSARLTRKMDNSP